MTRFLLLTANVGSLFEAECKLHEEWLDTIVKKIEYEQSDFVVLHMQETGGKHFVECAEQAAPLVSELCSRLPEYKTVRAYLDIEYDLMTFTALGSIIFIRDSNVKVEQFNFASHSFEKICQGVEILTKGLDDHPSLVKTKFPKHFWPALKWGRKGYMHTRWRIENQVYDFVNVHLFHDESNLALIHENPMLYSSNRKRALDHCLEQLKAETNGHNPYLFIFGDLNFRLDSSTFLERITKKSDQHALDDTGETHASMSDGLNVEHPESLRRSVSAIEFRRQSKVEQLSRGCVLRIEKKKFDYFDNSLLLMEWKSYLEDDKEVKSFADLYELPIDFPPTYPWSEDPTEHNLMKTRAPAWCDRVLMNETAHKMVFKSEPEYNSIGWGVCMGDHKPVALSFVQ